MKRVKAACIMQTLVFSQKPELGLNAEQALAANRGEVENYKEKLLRTKTRHKIVEVCEEADGSIILKVIKQYNDKAEVAEYLA